MKNAILLGSIIFALHPLCMRTMVTDADGNVYPAVRIGNQVWTADNVRTTKFNDGTPIPHVPDSVEWHNRALPAYCFYENTNNADSIRKHGALYNWFCVSSEKFAPPGWHVPTNDDWIALQEFLIEHGYNWDRRKDGNKIAKSLAAQNGWKPFTVEGTPGHTMKKNNRSGFSGIGAGFRYTALDTVAGRSPKSTFAGISHKGGWWSATHINESEAFAYGLGFCREHLIRWDCFSKACGHSVRLVKNEE